jgi:hypothetical protein
MATAAFDRNEPEPRTGGFRDEFVRRFNSGTVAAVF